MSAAGLRVTLTQMHAGPEPADNLPVILRLIAEAARAGSDLVTIPENALCLGSGERMRACAQSLADPAIIAICDHARHHAIAVYLGGIKRRLVGEPKVRNTAILIDATGEIRALYDKIHVFNANVGGQSFRASDIEAAGATPVVATLNGVCLGLTICYDVRFPELYRQLAVAGAQAFLVPAAFVHETGRAHWEVLLRARAIENGAYVIAPALMRQPGDTFETHGHALAVDPWGRVVADLGEQEYAFETVTVDTAAVVNARTRLPVLEQLRSDAYAAAVQEAVVPATADRHASLATTR
jgi:predicted amidohydrolase